MKTYKVGWKKPPPESQFKVGNKEHLKRRKKEDKHEGKILRDFLSTTVEYHAGGKLKKGSRLEVHVKSIGTAAVRGNIGAAYLLLNMREHGAELGELRRTILVFEAEDALV